MQIVRLIIWIAVTAIAVAFMVLNWGEPQVVKIWPGDSDAFLFEWPVGFIALVFFLLGFLPMWLIHRGVKWRLQRRISSLESAAQARVTTSTPAPTSTTPPPAPVVSEPAPDIEPTVSEDPVKP